MYEEVKSALLELGGEELVDRVLFKSALKVKKSSVLQKIVPRVYLGSWKALNNNCDLLRERNITHVVSVVSASERSLPKFIKGRLHIIANDQEGQGELLLGRFPDICAFAEKALAESPSNKIYFHCGAGVSRGPTSCIAFLMHMLSLGAADALNLVRERRKCIRPNVGFVAALKKWEAKVARRGRRREKGKGGTKGAAGAGAAVGAAAAAAAVTATATNATTAATTTTTTQPPKTLFAFKEVDGETLFVELKRPQFKGSEEKSRYVSWFRVEATGKATRLAFVSWDGDVRDFEQGTLTTPAEGEKSFVPAEKGKGKGKRIELKAMETQRVSAAIVAQCLSSWD